MDFLGHQKILMLKSRFFDLYNTKVIHENIGIITQAALEAIREVFGAVEVTLYTNEEWDVNWKIVSSTVLKNCEDKAVCLNEDISFLCEYKFSRTSIKDD